MNIFSQKPFNFLLASRCVGNKVDWFLIIPRRIQGIDSWGKGHRSFGDIKITEKRVLKQPLFKLLHILCYETSSRLEDTTLFSKTKWSAQSDLSYASKKERCVLWIRNPCFNAQQNQCTNILFHILYTEYHRGARAFPCTLIHRWGNKTRINNRNL